MYIYFVLYQTDNDVDWPQIINQWKSLFGLLEIQIFLATLLADFDENIQQTPKCPSKRSSKIAIQNQYSSTII